MTRLAWTSALALALVLPALASADDLAGNVYELTGRYSSRRSTAANVRIEGAGWNKYRVVRRGRFTSSSFRHLPEFEWRSEPGTLHGNLLVVRFAIDAAATSSTGGSIISSLGNNPSDAAMLSALAKGNVVRAIYKFNADRSQVREVAYNVTREGDQYWWRWIKSSGDKVVEQFRPTNAPGRLTEAQFNAATDRYIKDWYLEYIREGYESDLADATSAAERQRIRDDWDADKAEDPTDSIEGNEYWDDSVDDNYATKEYYRDSQNRPIPREDVIVYEFSFFTNLAGIGLSKVLVFDRATGELLDEGDIMD